ncbi:major facilitator superfamily domain-containing protein [Aspergillus filifer]
MEITEQKAGVAEFLSQLSAEDDKHIMCKVDRRVTVEPSNILTELSTSSNDYHWTQIIYYIGLVLFEIPSNLVLKRVSPHKWMARIFLTWGIVVACHAAIQNKAGFYALRFLLGALEAGFFPGLAAQIEYLELRLSDNAPRADEPDFSLKEIVLALKDSKMYLFTACQFLLNIAGYGLLWQLPTITTSLGFATLPRNQLLNIPPAAATVIGFIIVARMMRYALFTRPFFCQLLNGITLIFFIVLCLPLSPGATYAACVLGTTFYYVYFIPFWAWRSSSISGATGTAFAIAAQTAVAQLGGIIAPQVFEEKYAGGDGRHRASFIICTACCAGAMVSSQLLWWLTKDVERDVLRVRRNRIKTEKEGVYVGGDVRVDGGR